MKEQPLDTMMDQHGSPSIFKRQVEPAFAEVKIDFESRVLGRMRSTGDIICLLLALEDKDQVAEILADVIKEAGIDINQVLGWYHDRPCPDCGISLMSHGVNGCD